MLTHTVAVTCDGLSCDERVVLPAEAHAQPFVYLIDKLDWKLVPRARGDATYCPRCATLPENRP